MQLAAPAGCLTCLTVSHPGTSQLLVSFRISSILSIDDLSPWWPYSSWTPGPWSLPFALWQLVWVCQPGLSLPHHSSQAIISAVKSDWLQQSVQCFLIFHSSSGRALDGIWISSVTLFQWGLLAWSLCLTLYCQCEVPWFILDYRTLQPSSACSPSLSSKIDCALSLSSERFKTNFCNISLGMTIANISSFKQK